MTARTIRGENCYRLYLKIVYVSLVELDEYNNNQSLCLTLGRYRRPKGAIMRRQVIERACGRRRQSQD